MNKKNIRIEYNKKIKQLIKLNEYYYAHSDPLVKDFEYDNLKKEILLLENQYKFLKSNESPSRLVGFKPSKNFKKALHKVPMLSLSNAFTQNDLLNFQKKNH